LTLLSENYARLGQDALAWQTIQHALSKLNHDSTEADSLRAKLRIYRENQTLTKGLLGAGVGAVTGWLLAAGDPAGALIGAGLGMGIGLIFNFVVWRNFGLGTIDTILKNSLESYTRLWGKRFGFAPLQGLLVGAVVGVAAAPFLPGNQGGISPMAGLAGITCGLLLGRIVEVLVNLVLAVGRILVAKVSG
ncbi:MAG: hypothetical protein KDJ52_12865, partial [Anaerolineae bacterium]|nr:hypothetical protein [Anaerolineae bacterium]